MRIPRLYHPEPLAVGLQIQLSTTAFRHTVQVLRLRADSPIIVFNGQGGEYQATLCEVGKRHAFAQLEAFCLLETEAPLSILLGQCISKAERMDFTLQKATELGVAAIQPLYSERSALSAQGDRMPKKLAHWQGVISSACEQCGRNRLPSLNTPQSLTSWLADSAADSARTGSKWLLDPAATQSLRQCPQPTEHISLLIGPEGGLSPQEIQQAHQHRFSSVRLGPRTLRTETAALTAIAAILTLWGDLA